MTPFDAEERAEILALNQGATGRDLDRLQELAERAHALSRADPERTADLVEEARALERALFPRLQEALRRVAARRGALPPTKTEPDDDPPAG